MPRKEEKNNIDGPDFIIQDDGYAKGCNKSRARLIKKIYEADPLICPKCGSQMRIIAFLKFLIPKNLAFFYRDHKLQHKFLFNTYILFSASKIYTFSLSLSTLKLFS